LYQAFQSDKLQITEKNVPKKEFGHAMAAFFPQENEDSIAHSLQPNRYATKGDGQIIIDDLIAYFKPIWESEDNTYAGTSPSWPLNREVKKNLVKL
jgi:hypothetical protein